MATASVTHKITPKPQDASRDFLVDAKLISKDKLETMADYSPDTKGYIPKTYSNEFLLRRDYIFRAKRKGK